MNLRVVKISEQLMIILTEVKLFIICIRFEKLVGVRLVTVRLYKVLNLRGALLVVTVGEGGGEFVGKTFELVPVPVHWAFHTVKETRLSEYSKNINNF